MRLCRRECHSVGCSSTSAAAQQFARYHPDFFFLSGCYLTSSRLWGSDRSGAANHAQTNMLFNISTYARLSKWKLCRNTQVWNLFYGLNYTQKNRTPSHSLLENLQVSGVQPGCDTLWVFLVYSMLLPSTQQMEASSAEGNFHWKIASSKVRRRDVWHILARRLV